MQKSAQIGGWTIVLVVLAILVSVFPPARAIAGSGGNITVSGTGITSTGSSLSINGAETIQSNSGQLQQVGSVPAGSNVSACGALAPSVTTAGLTAAGSSSGGGSASTGTATGGTIIGKGVAIGGNAVGGNAVGGNAVGVSQTGAATATGSRNGSAEGGSAVGGAAVGGSAINGSAIAGTLVPCASASQRAASMSALSDTTGDGVICGTIVGVSGTALNISTLAGTMAVAVPAAVSGAGVLPTSGNVCLLVSDTMGALTAIRVLACHGSTSGTISLSHVAPNNSALLDTNACGHTSVHSTTQSISNSSPSTTVIVSIDCPNPCTPGTPATSGQTAIVVPTGIPTGPVQPTSGNMPASLALRLSDLPDGFQQIQLANLDNSQVAHDWHMPLTVVDTLGHLGAFESTFQRVASTGRLSIADRVDVYRSAAAAHHLFLAASAKTALSSRAVHPRIFRRVGVGRESIEYSVATGAVTARTATLSLLFRRGHFVASITLNGRAALVTSQQIEALGHILDARLAAS